MSESRRGRRRISDAVAGALALAALVLAAALPSWGAAGAGGGRPPEVERTFESNGNTHVRPGEAHGAYFSNPPTSGWHLDPIPRPGIYTEPRTPEGLGHFMEHGGIWVLYTCPGGCEEAVRRLAELVDGAIGDGLPVALAPYPPPGVEAPEYPYNAVAWQVMLSLDALDEAAIRDFIDRRVCAYAPEGGGPYCDEARGEVLPARDAGPGGFGAVGGAAGCERPILEIREARSGTDGPFAWEPATGVGADGGERHLTSAYLLPTAEVTAGVAGLAAVALRFDEAGAALLEQITRRTLGRPLGIFVDGELVSAPVVGAVITGGGAIVTGLTDDEARTLADRLNEEARSCPRGAP